MSDPNRLTGSGFSATIFNNGDLRSLIPAENHELFPFPEVQVNPQIDPGGCVDGRIGKEKGKKMIKKLGGSLHAPFIQAVLSGADFTAEHVKDGLTQLAQTGYQLGVHRGSHKHPDQGTSDCGFADRMKDIVKKAQTMRDEMCKRLLEVREKNKDAGGASPLDGMDDISFLRLFNEVYDFIAAYDPDNIKIMGDLLIQIAEDKGAYVAELEHDHQEAVAKVNIVEGTTLDTEELAKQGIQAFDLDLWEAVKECETLGVDPHAATIASLIFFQATEMVLVEDKGKNALPVEIHK